MAALQREGQQFHFFFIVIISLTLCRERKQNWNSLDAFDPFVLLLHSWGGDSVESVVSLDDAAVCLRLAGLDHLIFVVGDEQLEAVLREIMVEAGRRVNKLHVWSVVFAVLNVFNAVIKTLYKLYINCWSISRLRVDGHVFIVHLLELSLGTLWFFLNAFSGLHLCSICTFF